MSGIFDDSNKDSVEEVATDYDEAVSVAADVVTSFDDFEGHQETKTEIRSKVTSRMSLGSYAPTSLLLHADEQSMVAEHLANGVAGELPPTWTTYHLHETKSKVGFKTNALESVLNEARTAAPSVVVIECLDDYDFDEEQYDCLNQHLSELRVNETPVLIVGTTSDVDSELLTNESVFEVIIEVPKPDDHFRKWLIDRELDTAADNGIIRKPSKAWETGVEYELSELEIDKLKVGVKRAIQRQLQASPDDTPPIRPEHIEASLQRLEVEMLEKSSTPWGLEAGSAGDEYQPEIPSVTFADIGGLETEKQRLRKAVSLPMRHADIFDEAGYSVGQGILLHGLPGNGKTMLAKAVANELSYRFFAVKGPEMEAPLVGETERKIRELFEAARDNAPSVIFFDEFDSVAPDRDSVGDSYKQDQVNALLAELDGMDPLEEVIVLAATNRKDQLDAAVLRSGRFDTTIDISAPNTTQKQEIFELQVQQLSTAPKVSAEWFTTLDITEVSGADIATICRKALETAVSEYDANSRSTIEITRSDIEAALTEVTDTDKSVSHPSGYQ